MTSSSADAEALASGLLSDGLIAEHVSEESRGALRGLDAERDRMEAADGVLGRDRVTVQPEGQGGGTRLVAGARVD